MCRLSFNDAFEFCVDIREFTTDVIDFFIHISDFSSDRLNLFAKLICCFIYFSDLVRDTDMLHLPSLSDAHRANLRKRELVKETLNEDTNRYEKLANISLAKIS